MLTLCPPKDAMHLASSHEICHRCQSQILSSWGLRVHQIWWYTQCHDCGAPITCCEVRVPGKKHAECKIGKVGLLLQNLSKGNPGNSSHLPRECLYWLVLEFSPLWMEPSQPLPNFRNAEVPGRHSGSLWPPLLTADLSPEQQAGRQAMRQKNAFSTVELSPSVYFLFNIPLWEWRDRMQIEYVLYFFSDKCGYRFL